MLSFWKHTLGHSQVAIARMFHLLMTTYHRKNLYCQKRREIKNMRRKKILFLINSSHFATRQNFKPSKWACKIFFENSVITCGFLVRFPPKPQTNSKFFRVTFVAICNGIPRLQTCQLMAGNQFPVSGIFFKYIFVCIWKGKNHFIALLPMISECGKYSA